MFTDYTTTFTVDASPDEVYAVINDVRRWWTGDIVGDAAVLGSEFTYQHADVHRSTQLVTELVPGKRVAWHVTDAYLAFSSDPADWTGTDITFDITKDDGTTQVRFTHVGLVPTSDCYESCSDAWSYYVSSSLREAIESRGVDL
jgi:hypothetical protein